MESGSVATEHRPPFQVSQRLMQNLDDRSCDYIEHKRTALVVGTKIGAPRVQIRLRGIGFGHVFGFAKGNKARLCAKRRNLRRNAELLFMTTVKYAVFIQWKFSP